MAFWILGRRVKTCSKENHTTVIARRCEISVALASANGLTAFRRGDARVEN